MPPTVAQRPTGSIFKPFVYAAAYNTSLNGMNLDGNGPFTAVTKLNDDPQDFGTNGTPYTPGNFVKGEYPGMVTAVDALGDHPDGLGIQAWQRVPSPLRCHRVPKR